MLGPAVELANARLAGQGVERLPAGLSPHSLRGTFAMIHAELGTPPKRLSRHMTHRTTAMTFDVYAGAEDIPEAEVERLRALVEGQPWARSGSEATETVGFDARAPKSERDSSAL